MSTSRWILAILLTGASLASPAAAVPFIVVYSDSEGEGFFDPVHGEARRTAFEFAVARWEQTLGGRVPITMAVSMPRRGGTGAGAILASAGAVSIHRNFGATADTWYAAALANQLAGTDLNGDDNAEITILFNADIDRSDVLGSVSWYYGLDANPGVDLDLVSVALHEIGHGLGFFEAVNTDSGGWRNGDPAIFDRMLFRPQVGPFAGMRDGERLAAIVSPPLLWQGPAVTSFNGDAAGVFTPEPLIPGSSVAHWDPVAHPGEMMAPSSDAAMHDFGLLLPALVDMGWTLAVASPTPRMPSATPTHTPTASRTPPPFPEMTPADRQDVVYVANFDDDTVSVLDDAGTSSIPVGDGPAGIAASPDGRRVYATNFSDGTVSIISTRRGRVIATVPVGVSANGVAVPSNGKTFVVTDTVADSVSVIDASTHEIRGRIATAPAPAGIAVGPDDLVYVASYGGTSITVIDVRTGIRRAIIRGFHPNLLSIAFAADTGFGYAVSSASANSTTRIDGNALRSFDTGLAMPHLPQAILLRRDGSEIYVAGRNELVIFDDRHRELGRTDIASFPDGMAVSSDGDTLFVSSTGENALSVVDRRRRSLRQVIQVGAAPMGVAVAAVPAICEGDCNGDQEATVDELLRALTIALRASPVSICDAADHDDDGHISVDELLLVTSSLLDGCNL